MQIKYFQTSFYSCKTLDGFLDVAFNIFLIPYTSYIYFYIQFNIVGIILFVLKLT